jgi:hypothetical protein
MKFDETTNFPAPPFFICFATRVSIAGAAMSVRRIAQADPMSICAFAVLIRILLRFIDHRIKYGKTGKNRKPVKG